MLILTLPVHPLSRRILSCELGAEPFAVPNHHLLFHFFNRRPTARGRTTPDGLSASVDLGLNARTAQIVQSDPAAFGAALFKLHKSQLVLFVNAFVAAKGLGHARPAAAQFLELYGVDETEYSLDAAYKLWQRACWEIEKKNRAFLVQTRLKAASGMSKKIHSDAKRAQAAPVPWVGRGIDIELAHGRFANTWRSLYLHPSEKLIALVRRYLYYHYSGVSQRALSARHGWHQSSVSYAARQVEALRQRNHTLNKVLAEVEAGLRTPDAEETPSLRVSHLTLHRPSVRAAASGT